MVEERVPPGAQILFEEIVRACGRRGYTWALQTGLAEALGVSDRTVRRWEARLVEVGLLSVARVSFWVRRERGGVRRLLVPHIFEGGVFRAPRGLLDRARAFLLDGKRVAASKLSRFRTRVSGTPFRMKRERGSTPSGPTRDDARTALRYLATGVDWVRAQGREFLERWGLTEDDARSLAGA